MRYLKHESTLYSVAPVGLALMPSKCASGKRFRHDGRTQRGGGQSFSAILCFVFDRQYSKYFTQNVHQIVQFECQKCKNSLVWQGGHPPPTPSPRSGASRPRLRCPTIKANNLPHPKKNTPYDHDSGPPFLKILDPRLIRDSAP